eukprot:TRINITY_DN3108_c0_g1_i1.p1 TRINITY_DN3108_c0_g1~~TRINITY_DN3108_c0_g1_i1.p1  ORF type:complete len:509 (-),score=117.45 TRINITY_DN3108_c0_g1_i1:135-1568(-)
MAELEVEKQKKVTPSSSSSASATSPSGKKATGPQLTRLPSTKSAPSPINNSSSVNHLTPRKAALVERLKQLHLDLADPAVRETLEVALSGEGCLKSQADETLNYYRQRPELSKYTLDRELPRMAYQVTHVGSDAAKPLTEPEAIRKLYEAETCEADVAQAKGNEILWRMANQSIFAGALEAVHTRVVMPHDDGGALCLSAATEEAEFFLNLVERRVRATCNLSLGTIGGQGGRLRLAIVSLVVDIQVSEDGQRSLTFKQSVGELRPEVVFDEELAATAMVLAEMDSATPQHSGFQQSNPNDEVVAGFAGVRAAAAIQQTAASAFGVFGDSALGAAAWGFKALRLGSNDDLTAGGQAAPEGQNSSNEVRGNGQFNNIFDRLAGGSGSTSNTGGYAGGSLSAQSKSEKASSGGYSDIFDKLASNSEVAEAKESLKSPGPAVATTTTTGKAVGGTAASAAVAAAPAPKNDFDDLFDSLTS